VDSGGPVGNNWAASFVIMMAFTQYGRDFL